jgi:PPM family protein phosphatase
MAPVTAAPSCPACRREADTGARYCEQCGYDLAGPAAPPVRMLVGGAGPPDLGPLDLGPLDLGAVAGVSEAGRRTRNEDALAIGAAGEALAAVVCDGVSTSERPETAARAAAAAGLEALLAVLSGGAPAAVATRAGGLAAARAAAAQAGARDVNPPACTYVSAIVAAGTIVIGWIGDSPAYWVPAGGQPRRLTVDDSAAGRLAAAGVPPEDARYALPQAYALDRWLGADAAGGPPRVTALSPQTAGMVLVCSDGLSVEDADLAAAVGVPPVDAATDLLRRALAAGSHDNITVAVLSYPPGPVEVAE